MKVTAPGKVNLYLEVLGKRNDGFHEVVTVLKKIALYDELDVSISADERIRLSCDREDIPTGPGSLLSNTVELFLNRAQIKRTGFSVHLKKAIPVAAGLGGGSSDAAALLKAMNSLTGEPLDRKELNDIAASLGCDVPFFISDAEFAIGKGRGDEIEPLLCRAEFAIVLLRPPFGTSSGDIYCRLGRLSLTKKGCVDRMLSAFSEAPVSLETVCKNLRNDLQIAVLQEFPELDNALGMLKEAGCRGALISGSGPTIFGLVPKETVKDVLNRIKSGEFLRTGWELYSV